MIPSREIMLLLFGAFFVAGADSASAACSFAAQGEGHVTTIIDGRTFRLDDGREVRLAGIETDVAGALAGQSLHVLASLIGGRDVILQADDDTPDRYGRQTATVFIAGSQRSIQTELLSQGGAVISAAMLDKACSDEWVAAEGSARIDRRGLWGDLSVTKNAESPGDILAGIGRFTLVEGKVLSARQAGTTFYVNFGRQWTQGFAVTISRRMMPSFEAAGLDFKTLTGKTIRVRGWVEKHGGPRIDAVRVGQIEILSAAKGIAENIAPQNEGK